MINYVNTAGQLSTAESASAQRIQLQRSRASVNAVESASTPRSQLQHCRVSVNTVYLSRMPLKTVQPRSTCANCSSSIGNVLRRSSPLLYDSNILTSWSCLTTMLELVAVLDSMCGGFQQRVKQFYNVLEPFLKCL